MSAPGTGTWRIPLFPAGTTATGSSQHYDLSHYGPLTVYVTAVGTISTGTLLIEEADWNPDTETDFGGTWSTVQTIDLTALTGASAPGNQTAYHIPTSAPGSYAWAFVRARISVAVTGTGGSVKVVMRARA